MHAAFPAPCVPAKPACAAAGCAAIMATATITTIIIIVISVTACDGGCNAKCADADADFFASGQGTGRR